MKIMHCCLGFEYVDNLAYQENILPLMHKRMGFDVIVLTSTIVDRDGMEKYELNNGEYILDNGIKIIRNKPAMIPYIIEKKLRIIDGVYDTLEKESPDIVFIHEVNSVSIVSVCRYLKKHKNVKAFADNHNDYFNSGRNKLSLYVLHKTIYRYLCKKINPYIDTFWGTLPARCDFLHDVYGVPQEKIDFLPMGFDDFNVPYLDKKLIRKKIRESLGILESDFVIITGGKIDNDKKIIEVMKAIHGFSGDVKLIIFGKPTIGFKDYFENQLLKANNVKYIGWVDSREVYKYFFASDLACFPGGHSVLWEQAVACGLPSIFMKRPGMQHVDLGGNCVFIDHASTDIIHDKILDVFSNKKEYLCMKDVAEEIGRQIFSYERIAIKSIKLEGGRRK